jgi:39S ribosomal protein L53/MRP-L53
MLKHLKRVFISFHPADPGATCARELLARVGNPAARKSNPNCAVEYEVDEAAAVRQRSFIELQFSDDEKRTFLAADIKTKDIISIIHQKGAEMELRTVMRDVAFDPYAPAGRGAGDGGTATGTAPGKR